MKNIIFTPGPTFTQLPSSAVVYTNIAGDVVVDTIVDDAFQAPKDAVVHYEAVWDGKSPAVDILTDTSIERVHAYAGWPTEDRKVYEAKQAQLEVRK